MAMNPLTDIQALQFAIDFAQAEKVPKDALEIRRFVVTRESPIHDATGQTPADITVLQKRTRALLQALVMCGHVTVDRRVRTMLVRAGPPMKPVPNYTSPRQDVIVDVSELTDRFINRLIRAFENVGLEKLQVCQAPAPGRHDDAICGRLFLKVTRKEYCSTRCQSRTYMRGYNNPEGSGNGKKTR
jgi:hypothetical protein